jgi:hypothetical protein
MQLNPSFEANSCRITQEDSNSSWNLTGSQQLPKQFMELDWKPTVAESLKKIPTVHGT